MTRPKIIQIDRRIRNINKAIESVLDNLNKSNKAVGFAIAIEYEDGMFTVGNANCGYALVGVLETLKQDILNDIYEVSE